MAHDGPTGMAQSNSRSIGSKIGSKADLGSRADVSATPVANKAIAEPVSTAEQVARTGATDRQQYKASFAYHPDAADELEFEVGDEIVEAQLVAEGWLYGTN